METTQGRRPITGLIAELWRDSAQLVRGEAALAKAEFTEKATQIGTGVAWIGAGAVVLLAGLVFLLIAAMTGLAMALPEDYAPWLAPLLIGAVTVAIGAFLVARGKRELSPAQLKPTQSPRSVRKDVEILKEHI